MNIGIISDTHGLMRPQALAALAQSDTIIHAGDVGSPVVLAALEAIAPVFAVRGNGDVGPWAELLPETLLVPAGAHFILVIHDLKKLGPLQQDIVAVVSGHSHKPALFRRDGILFLNPGSAGRRRFRLPVAMARMRVDGGMITAEIIELGTP